MPCSLKLVCGFCPISIYCTYSKTIINVCEDSDETHILLIMFDKCVCACVCDREKGMQTPPGSFECFIRNNTTLDAVSPMGKGLIKGPFTHTHSVILTEEIVLTLLVKAAASVIHKSNAFFCLVFEYYLTTHFWCCTIVSIKKSSCNSQGHTAISRIN